MRHFIFALICLSLSCKKDPPPPMQESAARRYVALFAVPTSMGLEGASEGAKCLRSNRQPSDPSTTNYACGSRRAEPFVMRPHDPAICEQREMNIPTGFYELPYPTWIESVDSTPCRSGWRVTVGTEAESKRRQAVQRQGVDLVPAGSFEVTPTTSRGNVPPEGVLMMRLMMRLSGDAGNRPPGTVVELREGDIIARCTIRGFEQQECISGRVGDPKFADAGVEIERL